MEDANRKNLKGISKALYILSKIGKIVLSIVIPFIVLAMIAIFFVFNKFSYVDNTFYFDEDRLFSFKEDISGITMEFNDDLKDSVKIDSQMTIMQIKDYLDHHNTRNITLFIELALLFTLAIVVISRIILHKVELLFKSIYEKDNPFIQEHADYIKTVGILLIVNAGISIFADILLPLIVGLDVNFRFDFNNVYEILIVFAIYYIFLYGISTRSSGKKRIDVAT